ncbi:MAG: hypothetical protein V2J24_23745 [Pseudomonadales bacterium]|jgi:hypothetical protein|nr:hypothetical protein [Pseudomonadales bacterium]
MNNGNPGEEREIAPEDVVEQYLGQQLLELALRRRADRVQAAINDGHADGMILYSINATHGNMPGWNFSVVVAAAPALPQEPEIEVARSMPRDLNTGK